MTQKTQHGYVLLVLKTRIHTNLRKELIEVLDTFWMVNSENFQNLEL